MHCLSRDSLSRSIRWLTLTLTVGVISLGLICLPTEAAITGKLETPTPGSFQSGIGIVRGWVCNASRIVVEADNTATLPAIYGEARADTQSTCGDSNNGFSAVINWNELGEGAHVIRALADGTEFGRVTVIVATLGEKFLRDASSILSITSFPKTGQQTRLRWEEVTQQFALFSGNIAGVTALSSSPRTLLETSTRAVGESSSSQALLETPAPGSFQSGIAIIRGWVCRASRVDIEADSRITFPAVYGEARADTADICGDTNNGFSVVVNWNDLGDGAHTVRALADGVEFARADFTVVTLGLGSFARGLIGDALVEDFPRGRFRTRVAWEESQQNFVITGARFPGVDDALCTTRQGQAIDSANQRAAVTITNSCLLSGNTVTARIEAIRAVTQSAAIEGRESRAASTDSFFICAAGFGVRQGNKVFTGSDLRLFDFDGNEVCRELPFGSTLDTILHINANSSVNFNVPFAILYAGQEVVVFPGSSSSAGQPALDVTPSKLIFGRTRPGLAQSEEATGQEEREVRSLDAPQDGVFTISNPGTDTLIGGVTTIAFGSQGDVFQVVEGNPFTIKPGESQDVTIRLTPIGKGPFLGSARISTNGGTETVLLFGGGQSPQLLVSPGALDFGVVLPKASFDLAVTITNIGDGPLTGSALIPDVGPFSLVGNGNFILEAGESQGVIIRFAPDSVALALGSVIVTSDGGSATVVLSGGTSIPRLCVFPPALDFGIVSSETANLPFTVQNCGGGTLTGSAEITSGDLFSLESVGLGPVPFSLGPDQSRIITVNYDPDSDFPPPNTGTVSILSNAGQAQVQLSGDGSDERAGLIQ